MVGKLSHGSIIWHLEGKLESPEALAEYSRGFGDAAGVLEAARGALLAVRRDYDGASLTLYREGKAPNLDFLLRAGNVALMKLSIALPSGELDLSYDNRHVPNSYASALIDRIKAAATQSSSAVSGAKVEEVYWSPS